MLRPVNHEALSVAGFTTPWIAAPGTCLTVHVSTSRRLHPIRIVRLDRKDPEVVNWPVNPTGEAETINAFSIGSWLRIAAEKLSAVGRPMSITLEVMLTQNEGPRRLLDWGGAVLDVSSGIIALRVDGVSLIECSVPSGVWMTLQLERTANHVGLSVQPHDDIGGKLIERRAMATASQQPFADILIGSDAAGRLPAVNARYGRIDVITDAGPVGWRFPTLLSMGPLASVMGIQGIPLEIVNLPTFCVRSRRWDGTSFDPRHVPEHYDAIHCHDDDMYRVDWPVLASIAVPPDAPSGVYACEMMYEGGSEQIVFFVSASRATAPLLFVIPTATYLAYANEVLPPHLYPWVADDKAHRFAQQNDLRSLYDFHNDLSGVSITTDLKPMPTLRSDYVYPLCGCPHNLPVDLRLLRFLHQQSISVDVVTDHDLHLRGDAILAQYRGVLTGSHPEYVSPEIDQCLRSFLARGGSLAYLGGNGFSGTVAFQGDLMELRRSPLEAARTWDGPISEQHLALTNRPGGYLRDIGRGEFSLVGGAMSLMGFGPGRPFTRTAESHAEDVAWLFDGMRSKVFGESGVVLGAAASYEVDGTDLRMGTSPDTIIVARATGFPYDFYHDASRWYADGESEKAGHRCAEMTLRFLSSGGIIFSASSVGWCGALPESGMNDVGRITLNVIGRIQRS